MKITSKIMAFWYFASAIFGGAAAVLLFLLIRKLSKNRKEDKPSFKPIDKDLKDGLQIVQILNEIYKV